jgi:chemotaxis protein methyltransferase CheR
VLGDRGRRLVAARRPFHAWYLGAGTGEGAYSLAAALDDALDPHGRVPYHVWASGSSEAEAEHARRAVYPLVFAGGLRPETLKRFFLRGTGLQAGLCTVKPAIRAHVDLVPGGDLEAADGLPPIDLAFVGLDAEAFAIASRGPLAETLAALVAPAGLLLVPSWPRTELPLPGFDRLDTGIFVRSPRTRGGARLA